MTGTQGTGTCKICDWITGVWNLEMDDWMTAAYRVLSHVW